MSQSGVKRERKSVWLFNINMQFIVVGDLCRFLKEKLVIFFFDIIGMARRMRFNQTV